MNASSNATRWLVVAAVVVWALGGQLLSRHHIDLLNFAAILAVGGLGVGLLLGQCGIVNLAQASFYGIGAYASAYSTTVLGWPAPAGAAAGLLASAALAAAIGLPVLRLGGFFLALATLAVGSIANVLFFEWDWLTGGTLGIGGIPKLSLFGFLLDTPERYYYFAWPLVALLLWLVDNLVKGRPGLAMRAMRDAAPAAQVLGIDMHRLKTAMFVLSAMLGSLAGSLFAHYVSFVSVQSFTVERSIVFLLVPVVAGARSTCGVVIGALFVSLVPELLSGLGDFHQVLFGAVLVLVVTLMPGGIMGGLAGMVGRMHRRTFGRTQNPALKEVR
ncbi:branched-chain amino acid ABC transporter permease [Cupriavidus sp. WGlv3]|uniref:branched-chain amino acid ABC transporter permease n=1 Tax=Cupriavidus sp. WGlv3 TaxID=2919924 RepID=UPI0020909BF7|nr:branched-chain amino acid ABC transporter permease [Cupriavidus sp. WGlv3]MCO4860586.1 branched-chain amino acid ABC transporter permease [Cupriavidus sp. WGlv3]